MREFCIVLCVSICAAVQLSFAQELDRILAIVSGHVILASDVRGFDELGLIEVEAEGEQEHDSQILTKLIERRLALDEISRFFVGTPTNDRVNQALTRVRSRFSNEVEFLSALAAVGLDTADLREIIYDDLRLEAYLNERFGLMEEISESELRAYYEANRERFVEDQSGFESIKDKVRAVVWEESRGKPIQEWLSGLIRRGTVTLLDP